MAPGQARLDLDMEELSGSLLVDENPRGPAVPSVPAPRPEGGLPFVSGSSLLRTPSPRAALPFPAPLPKPTPPQRHEVALVPSETTAAANFESSIDSLLTSPFQPLPPPSPPRAPPEPFDDDAKTVVAMPAMSTPPRTTDATEATDALLETAALGPAEHPPARAVGKDVDFATVPLSALEPIDPAVTVRKPAPDEALTQFRAPAFKPPSGPSPRPRWPVPAVAAGGLALGIGLVFAVSAARHRHADASSSRPVEATALPSAAATPLQDTPTAQPPAPSAAPVMPASRACTVAGAPHVIAASAVVGTGVEVRALGGDIALGFAPSERQGMLARLDPTTLAVADTTVTRAGEVVRRATPIPGKKGRLGLAVDTERKSEPLQGRKTLPLDPPLQVGAAGGFLAWAPVGRKVAGKLWALEGEGDVEALRGARSETDLSSVAIAFRQGAAVWAGIAQVEGGLNAKGSLLRWSGLGPSVGSPAVAFSDGVVLVSWADRAGPDDLWRLRWTRFKTGEAASEAKTFSPPPGGRGDQAMSPGLAVVPSIGFLLVWTEGKGAAHEVRAQTLSSAGDPVGTPLRVSNDGVNAGQGQAAVASDGRGVVAFLEANSAGGFQLVATPIVCVP